MASDHFALQVRGRLPAALGGSLIVAASRRHKERAVFSRWQEATADLIRLDLYPGRPGRVEAHLLPLDGHRLEGAPRPAPGAAGLPRGDDGTACGGHPNHGVNLRGDTVWATNLLFGAPLEVDLERWEPRRVLRHVACDSAAPRVSSTSHFAWSPDGRHAYYHQSLLERETADRPVRARDLRLVELDARCGAERVWSLRPPAEDADLTGANFHSAFCFEEGGQRYVGLLKTGVVLEHLEAREHGPHERRFPSASSTLWIIRIDPERETLAAELLPGIAELGGLALSHLHVDAGGGDGFTLYANFKEADVADETRGVNVYEEPPEAVREHYSGMIVEALRCGLVIRYERRGGRTDLKTFRRPYDPSATSGGHTWLPINLATDAAGRHLFASFNGFRPRLLSRHLAAAYPERSIEPSRVGYVPPLLLRLDAERLEPDDRGDRGHLGYAEPVAFALVEDPRGREDLVCTFSPEAGLRIFASEDLTRMIGHAYSPRLLTWGDTHFRPEPAHMAFVAR